MQSLATFKDIRTGSRAGTSTAILKKQTLTSSNNELPALLSNAHKGLDGAVFAAYGWPADLSDDDLLARLLSLNIERTKSSNPPEA